MLEPGDHDIYPPEIYISNDSHVSPLIGAVLTGLVIVISGLAFELHEIAVTLKQMLMVMKT